MLQFITVSPVRYSVAEQARMVIEGGCRWIQISSESADSSETCMRKEAEGIIDLCTENEVFLVLENDVALVEDLKVHGVFLTDCSRESVAAARERLGAHAVVGTRCRSYGDIEALKGLDVDYVSVPADGPAAEFYAAMKRQMTEAGIEFHLVAEGEFGTDELAGLLAAGCAGVAMSTAIAEAGSPAVATREVLDALDRGREEADRNRI